MVHKRMEIREQMENTYGSQGVCSLTCLCTDSGRQNDQSPLAKSGMVPVERSKYARRGYHQKYASY